MTSELLAYLRVGGHFLLALALVWRIAVQLRPDWRRPGYRFLDIPLAVGGLALFITHFVAALFYVPSRSMAPTLEVLDGLVVNRLAYLFREPGVGDIVVFQHPTRGDMVKRIVAVGGDTVCMQDGQFFRNEAPESGAALVEGQYYPPRLVKPGCFFVLGDNRGNSIDSRSYGDVERGWLYGPVVFRYWPLARLGRI